MPRKQSSASIRDRLFWPLSLLLVALFLVMIGAVYFGGVLPRLEQGAVSMLTTQVENRKNYLESDMTGQWSDLSLAVEAVNQSVEDMRGQDGFDLSRVDTDKATYLPILKAASGRLISTMRANSVTGAFVVLSGEPLDPENPQDKRTLYLRDIDPASRASLTNEDILLKRAPVELVEQLDIATDSDWRPQLSFSQNGTYEDFFLRTYTTAQEHPELSWRELGYWSRPYSLLGDSRPAISYTVPLILDDGTVYGVLGIEITLDYLSRIVPARELPEGQNGSYFLALTQDGEQYQTLFSSSTALIRDKGQTDSFTLTPSRRAQGCVSMEGAVNLRNCAVVRPLTLYNADAPFASERWVLIGMVGEQDMFAFADHVRWLAVILGAVLLAFGLITVHFVSRKMAKPIVALTAGLEHADKTRPLHFDKTYISEIDRLTGEIETLSDSLFTRSLKFAEILRMASAQLGGFDIDTEHGKLFVTEGFFALLRISGVDESRISIAEFYEKIKTIEQYVQTRSKPDENQEECVLRIPETDGYVYIRVRYMQQGSRTVGLAEDVTSATIDWQCARCKRDHDLLTGLLSRRAFCRRMESLLAAPSGQLGVAALLLIELDNLRFINDTYGHDYGDQYIRCLAQTLEQSTPPGTLLCRQSGKEMYVFYYGYQSKKLIDEQLTRVYEQMSHQQITLPNGTAFPLSASGGVAWYPEDGANLDGLTHAANLAMFDSKGSLTDFDAAQFRTASHLQKRREDFSELIARERVSFFWQPIVRVADGVVFAYEALMRSELETLHTPRDILEAARLVGQLEQIERLTFFGALKSFAHYSERGAIAPECRAFLNSLPNRIMEPLDIDRFAQQFVPLLHRMVVEFTVSERIRPAMLEQKRAYLEKWNAGLALDNYGSEHGYSDSVILDAAEPNFIKIDMALVRGVDKDAGRQEQVRGILNEARARGAQVVAEGVETREELETLTHMGVEFVQGFLLARPAQTPPPVAPEIATWLRAMHDMA